MDQINQYNNQLKANYNQTHLSIINRSILEISNSDFNRNTVENLDTMVAYANENTISTKTETKTIVHTKVSKKNKTKSRIANASSKTKIYNANIFYAKEQQDIIGIDATIGKENPSDNFFTVDIPYYVDFDTVDILLKYSVYGVGAASQTTKSINNSTVYGGQIITTNSSWTTVEEYVPSCFIKKGNNDIFFNRRADKTYQYKVKDLRIELVKKQF